MPLTKATQNVVEGIVSTGSTGISAGSFIAGQQYKITSLGTTTQSQWNTIAGTTGQTYVVGSLFTAATIGASSGNGAAAVARTLANRFADVINVKDFGAVGDGVADDTAAIQAAVAQSENKALYFPSGTYIVSNIINLKSNSVVYGEPGNTTLKLKSQTYTSDNVSIFKILLVNNVLIYGLRFDGNKGNIGTTRNPINTAYRSTKITFDTCEWVNCEGICLNVANAIDNFAVLNCRFTNCGGKPDNSDGYRKQAIAISADVGIYAKNIEITGNYFFEQGLDCISMSNLQNVVVSDNAAYDSYSFLYNGTGKKTTNLTVTGNVIYNTTQGSLVDSTPPAAIDLPWVENATITGNAIYLCDQAGIGIFNNSKNIVVSGNSLLDCGRSAVSWYGPISVGDDTVGASNISEVIIANNNIASTGNVTKMKFGILIVNDIQNLAISDNAITNPLTARYGYFDTGTPPGPSTVFALTNNTQISSTTLINDLDTTNQLITNWRKTNTLTGYYFNSTKVVGERQPAIANSSDSTTNLILAALRQHGLIAT